jgi:two-component system, sensor histidine kinase and response regulator
VQHPSFTTHATAQLQQWDRQAHAKARRVIYGLLAPTAAVLIPLGLALGDLLVVGLAAVCLVALVVGHRMADAEHRNGVALALLVGLNVALLIASLHLEVSMAVEHVLLLCSTFVLIEGGRPDLQRLAVVAPLVSCPLESVWWRAEGGSAVVVALLSVTTTLAILAVMEWLTRTHAGVVELASRASATKSELLAKVSHEIRTPLNGVMGMLGLLRDTPLTEAQRDYVDTATCSSQALLALIDDILDLSRVEAGKLELEALPFELRATLEEVLDSLAPRAADKHVELMLRYPSSTPSHVAGDAARLRQVMSHLVGNAVELTEQGHVLVSVTHDASAQPPCFTIAVEDTRPGPAPDQPTLVRRPLRRADGSSSRTPTGTGLGLPVTRQLVERMGGTLELRREAGRASVLTVRLPFPLRDSLSSAEQLPRADLRGLRVLVVDDHPVSRRLLEEQLACWEMRVTLAAGASEARQLARRAERAGEPFELALLDYQMPEQDGLGLARALREVLRRPPLLVLLTSRSKEVSTSAISAAGFRGHLVKPLHLEDLRVVMTLVWAQRDSASAQLFTRQVADDSPSLAAATPWEGRARTLVVDDNPINLKVAVRNLEKLGCEVYTASDGREAVARARELDLDVVFMDVQMPVMDGFEATRVIRAAEAGSDRRLPIVAMTAHAMPGYKELCLQAGMDGYIAKPLRITDMARALGRWLGAAPQGDEPRQAGPGAGSGPAPAAAPVAVGVLGLLDAPMLDRTQLDEVTEGDPELTRELLGMLFENGATTLDDASRALDRGEDDGVRRSIHSLKGAAATLGAARLSQACKRMEGLRPDQLPRGLEEVRAEFAALRKASGHDPAPAGDPTPVRRRATLM